MGIKITTIHLLIVLLIIIFLLIIINIIIRNKKIIIISNVSFAIVIMIIIKLIVFPSVSNFEKNFNPVSIENLSESYVLINQVVDEQNDDIKYLLSANTYENTKFRFFDIAFNDGAFVNLTFYILFNDEYSFYEKSFQITSSGKLLSQPHRSIKLTDGLSNSFIPLSKIQEFFMGIDDNLGLKLFDIESSNNVNLTYRGIFYLSDINNIKDMYILHNNQLKLISNYLSKIDLEKEYYFFHVFSKDKYIYVLVST